MKNPARVVAALLATLLVVPLPGQAQSGAQVD